MTAIRKIGWLVPADERHVLVTAEPNRWVHVRCFSSEFRPILGFMINLPTNLTEFCPYQ
ncbi:Protein of unknown function [Pyronema omphalodes CBS 100304]|uniref:Uncharacterized protein n=1 Tax=Pyronema omphalodes (strain CBS 100304) TaxID=1076935 RepID=U4L054_PYROM|nr:Protein of unknown function [Pyronema omphalodes CBS 100304]